MDRFTFISLVRLSTIGRQSVKFLQLFILTGTELFIGLIGFIVYALIKNQKLIKIIKLYFSILLKRLEKLKNNVHLLSFKDSFHV